VTEDVLAFASGLAMYAYQEVLQTRHRLGSFGLAAPYDEQHASFRVPGVYP
jgi:hypothetical protein